MAISETTKENETVKPGTERVLTERVQALADISRSGYVVTATKSVH